MIITSITTKYSSIELKNPFITSLRRVEVVESIQVSIVTDRGIIGIGSAPPTKAITGEDLVTIVKSIETIFIPLLVNKKVDLALIKELADFKINYTSAKCSLDLALYDILSQSKNIPLYQLLGTKKSSIQTDVTISLNSVKQMSEDSQEAIQNGFNILKIKLGSSVVEDLQRVNLILKKCPNAKLLLDINQAYTLEESLSFIGSLESQNILLMEQPTPANDLESLKKITQKSNIPILADESVFSYEDAKFIIKNRCADMINIKLMKCGGIYNATKIAELCRTNGVKCMIGSMLEDPYSIEYAMHFAMANLDVINVFDLDSPLLYKSMPSYSNITFNKNILSLKQ
ncbi:MAG: dipeptide epimerase [Helicobacteraceae bacterium]|nr:dipeptide epimerase [Helicobacteraceae bacterium]